MKPSPLIDIALAPFNLSAKERDVYLAALELGESLQLTLAKQARLKRTTLREHLPDMVARGILVEVVRGKRRLVSARHPAELIDEAERRLNSAREQLPLLTALKNDLPSKPQVYFYEGTEGVKQVYKRTLNEGDTLYSFVDVSDMDPELARYALKEYVPERETRQIIAKNIISDSAVREDIIPDTLYRQNKLMPANSFPFTMEVAAFGGWVMLNHLRRGAIPSSILIRSDSLADTIRAIHNALWSTL
jgi:sugar-specific transcriptional regulator TrmB